MAFWTLAAHPANERVLDAVLEQEEEWWRTGGRHVARGDRVAIYKYKGHDAVRGVIAFGEVLTDPETIRLQPEDEPYVLPSSRRRKLPNLAPRVRVRYVRAARLPLWADQNAGSVVDELPVARAQGGTAHHVTVEQWDRLLEEAGRPDWTASGASYALENEVCELARGGGQGVGLTAPERSLVELRAMKLVSEYFVGLRWDVEDVSATSPYDLLCTRESGEERRVEVKGTIGDAATIFLTRNEVIAAQINPQTAVLAIVHGISLNPERTTASGGSLKIVNPWKPAEDALIPIAYRYLVPTPL